MNKLHVPLPHNDLAALTSWAKASKVTTNELAAYLLRRVIENYVAQRGVIK